MTYKPLDTTFKKSGFRFRQLIREGDLAIFHKVHIEGSISPKEVDAGFEVVVIQKNDEYIMGGVTIEAKESLPGNEKWGSKGWTCKNLLAAERRFERLKNGDIPEDFDETNSDSEEEHSLEDSNSVGMDFGKKKRRPRGSCPTDLNIPDGEFSTQELADFNEGAEYNDAAVFIRKNPDKVKPSGNQRPNARGKGKKITLYVKTS